MQNVRTAHAWPSAPYTTGINEEAFEKLIWEKWDKRTAWANIWVMDSSYNRDEQGKSKAIF